MASLRFSSQINTAEFPATQQRRRQSRCFGKNRVGFRVVAQNSEAEPDLSVTVNGLQMPNPFVIGSGPPGTNYTVMKRAFDEGWGAVIAKTVGFLHRDYDLCSVLLRLDVRFSCDRKTNSH